VELCEVGAAMTVVAAKQPRLRLNGRLADQLSESDVLQPPKSTGS